MKTQNYNFGELFKHPAETCSAVGAKTSVAFTSVDSDVLCKHRPASARKVVKANGFGRVLDYLYCEDSAVIYFSPDFTCAYVEFLLDKEYHVIVNEKGIIRFAEDDCPARWHMLLPILASSLIQLKAEKDTASAGNELFETLRECDKELSTSNALKFCDAYYYCVKETIKTFSVNFEDLTVIPEAERALASRAFVRFGNLTPDFTFLDEASSADSPSDFDIFAEETKKSTEDEKSSLWGDICAGKYLLDYEWPSIQKPFVTPLSFLDTYVPDKHFYHVFNQVEKRLKMALERLKKAEGTGEPCIASKRDAINIFIVGKPGTGKTYMIHALSAAFGIPIHSIPMGKNTEEDVFEGMTKIIDGNLTEVQTPFLINGAEGGISVIEEINLAPPDVVMGAIGQFVEFPYSIMEQGYKQVHRHPLNIIFGTMNIGTAGAKEVNEALSSRFPQTIILDDPDKNDFLARLEIEGFESKMCQWVYDRYTDVLETLKSPDYNCEEYCLNVTFRSCLGALQAIENGADPKDAIRNTIVGKIAEKDMEVAERIWDMIQSKPDFSA